MPAQHSVLLDYAYDWERSRANEIWLTQPLKDGSTRDYTWAEAMGEARRMAAHLRSLDMPDGSCIGVISKNCAEFILADLAIFMAGHVSVALYPTLNADTVQYCLEHCEAKLVFVGKLDDWKSMEPGVPANIPRIAFSLAPPTDFQTWESIVESTDPIEDNPSPDPDKLALIVYTSGSTGRPKGVMHSFGRIAVATRSVVERFQVTSEDRMLSYLPLAHVMERWLVASQSMMTASRIYFAQSIDTFVQDLKRARPTVFVSVPRLWLKFQQGVFANMPPAKLNRLLKIPILRGVVKKKILTNLGLDHARFAASGSAPIPAELIQWYRDLGLELLEGYGMSEDFCCSHSSVPGRGRVGYVGEPYPGVDVRISESGEIEIKSPGAMIGYYKEPEKTAECFTEDGYFKTGDRGERDELGRLKITGRVKELFKTSKGKYVSPAPIENLFNTDPNVELSCVTGSGLPAPIVIVTLSEELRPKQNDPATRARLEPELEALLQKVNSQVENFERMALVAVAPEPWLIENSMLTPTMKIKRASIEAEYVPKLDEWTAAGSKVVWG